MMPPEQEVPGGAPATREALPDSVPIRMPEYRWYHKMSAVLFITFCLEIGFFLMIFPWTEYWDNNYFSTIIPHWHRFWDNLYVRGAISGLGVVNLYISLVEMYRLRRFGGRG